MRTLESKQKNQRQYLNYFQAPVILVAAALAAITFIKMVMSVLVVNIP